MVLASFISHAVFLLADRERQKQDNFPYLAAAALCYVFMTLLVAPTVIQAVNSFRRDVFSSEPYWFWNYHTRLFRRIFARAVLGKGLLCFPISLSLFLLTLLLLPLSLLVFSLPLSLSLPFFFTFLLPLSSNHSTLHSSRLTRLNLHLTNLPQSTTVPTAFSF